MYIYTVFTKCQTQEKISVFQDQTIRGTEKSSKINLMEQITFCISMSTKKLNEVDYDVFETGVGHNYVVFNFFTVFNFVS